MDQGKESGMRTRTDLVLKTAKEVAVKFIETGRLSLSGFPEAFKTIYESIDQVVPENIREEPENKPAGDRAPKKK